MTQVKIVTILFVGLVSICYGMQQKSDVAMPTLFEMNTHVLKTMLKDEIGEDVYDKVVSNKAKRGSWKQKKHCNDNLGRPKCLFLKSNFACYTHPKRMNVFCGKTCGTCVPKVSRCHLSMFGCCNDGKTIALGPNQEGCQDTCKDNSRARICRFFKKSGQCKKNKAQMWKQCAFTCELCRPCEDEKPMKCKYMKAKGTCFKNRQMAMNDCRKTCGFCGVHDPCNGFGCQKGHKCRINKNLKPTCKCNSPCTEAESNTGIVCGRDGVEYQSVCDMKHATCGEKFPISAKHFGKCNKYSILDNINCSMVETDRTKCMLMKANGMCELERAGMAQACPITCGFCKAATDRFPCYRSKHGCCLDGKTQCLGPRYLGCPKYPECSDWYETLCKRFEAACGNILSEKFMKANCPKTCQYCNKW